MLYFILSSVGRKNRLQTKHLCWHLKYITLSSTFRKDGLFLHSITVVYFFSNNAQEKKEIFVVKCTYWCHLVELLTNVMALIKVGF